MFCPKPIDGFGRGFPGKARCCVRGNCRVEQVDFDPHGTYAPLASHDVFCVLLVYAAFKSLIVEIEDVASAYFDNKIDFNVHIQQRTIRSSLLAPQAGILIKQAGGVWGSLFIETYVKCVSKKSTTNKRTFFHDESNFFIICIVVDDLAFSSNGEHLLRIFKENLIATIDVRFFGS